MNVFPICPQTVPRVEQAAKLLVYTVEFKLNFTHAAAAAASTNLVRAKRTLFCESNYFGVCWSSAKSNYAHVTFGQMKTAKNCTHTRLQV